MSDIHALSGAYAVDALDDVERAEFETHLAECAECRAEVASFLETTARLADAEAETPPTSLRGSVLAGISHVRPLPPETTGSSGDENTHTVVRFTRRRLPQLLAAAASVVLLAIGVLAWQPWQHETTSVADQVLNASDAVRVTEKLPGGSGEITLVSSASVGRAVMIGEHVPDPPAGKTYQMWLQDPGRPMVSAGLMTDPATPTLLSGDASAAKAAAVSVEPSGGSVHPSANVVAVFPMKPASSGNGAT